MIEVVMSIKAGTTWEETGFLDGLSDTEKYELKKLFNIGVDILENEIDPDPVIQTLMLPCIRRIYTGLHRWYITSQTYINMLGQKNSTGIPFVFSNPETIHNMLITKFYTLKKGMDDALTTTDTQAEATALLCEDYIRSVKELVRKDIESVKKIVNREMLLSEILG